MKKDYVKPHMVAIEIECGRNLLESSYVDIGGTTDRFNSRRRNSPFDDWYEDEDEKPRFGF